MKLNVGRKEFGGLSTMIELNSDKKLARDLGFDAASEGQPRNSNPFKKESPLYLYWDLGWLDFSNVDNEITSLFDIYKSERGIDD